MRACVSQARWQADKKQEEEKEEICFHKSAILGGTVYCTKKTKDTRFVHTRFVLCGLAGKRHEFDPSTRQRHHFVAQIAVCFLLAESATTALL